MITYREFNRRPIYAREQIRIAQLDRQGGRCALCDVEVLREERHRLVADHCHVTDRLRGLICFSCNSAMAAVDRGDEWLARARAYRDSAMWFA